MPERFKAFRLYDIEQARQKPPTRLPLTFTQQELVGLAQEYKKVTGEKIPQKVLADETDVTRGAVNIQVRSILEKGYNPPIVTAELVSWPARKNHRRLRALRMKVQLIQKIKDLRLQGLTQNQIHRRIGRRAISENSLENILERLRQRGEIPRLRKKRSKEETASRNASIKKLRRAGLKDKEIAEELGVSYRVVTNAISDMLERGEMKRKFPKKSRK